MRKVVWGSLMMVALVLGALVSAPAVRAQTRGSGPDLGLGLFGPSTEVGISARDLRSDESAKLSGQGGVVVESVREGSPAARAGMKTGDIIVEFDGEHVRSLRQLARLIQETPANRTVRSVVVRDGSRMTLEISPEASSRLQFNGTVPDIRPQIERGLRALPRGFAFDLDAPRGRPPVARTGRLGVSISPLTDQLATFFGVKSGVLISGVQSDSPAARAGLKAGDVIIAINGRNVDDPLDVTEQVRSAGPGSSLDIRISRDKKEMTIKVTLADRAAPREGAQPV
jgi:serine protease Do